MLIYFVSRRYIYRQTYFVCQLLFLDDIVFDRLQVPWVHGRVSPGARMRTPEKMFFKERPHLLAQAPDRLLRVNGGTRNQELFIDDACAVVNAIVNRQASAKLRKNRTLSPFRNLAEAINDQSLVHHLEEPDFLFDGIRVERELA